MSGARAFVESSWPYEEGRLPEWYARPMPAVAKQCSLFALAANEVGEVLAILRISTDELRRWYARGWVSFDAETCGAIEPWHSNELRFVRDIVRSGLSDAQIETMLADLPRPLDFDPAQVAYNFSFGWVQVAAPPEPDVPEFIEEHLDAWLQCLAESDFDRLTTLRNHVTEPIASASESAQ